MLHYESRRRAFRLLRRDCFFRLFLPLLQATYHTFRQLVLVYVLTMAVVLIYGKVSPRTVRRIGIAAFNTLVLAVPFINYRSAFSPFEAVGAGIGAGVAYVIAVLLINNGLKRLDMNKTIPACFKGTPAMFIYTAILSLAFIGISGSSIFI